MATSAHSVDRIMPLLTPEITAQDSRAAASAAFAAERTALRPHDLFPQLESFAQKLTMDNPELDLEAQAHGCTIVQVALNKPLYNTFDYVLEGLYGEEILGCRIHVSFGRGQAYNAVGIVVGIGACSSLDYSRLKVAQLLDKKPLIARDVFNTLFFASRYYHYPVGQAMPLALPKMLREGGEASYKKIPGLKLNLRRVIEVVKAMQDDQERHAHKEEAKASKAASKENKKGKTSKTKAKDGKDKSKGKTATNTAPAPQDLAISAHEREISDSASGSISTSAVETSSSYVEQSTVFAEQEAGAEQATATEQILATVTTIAVSDSLEVTSSEEIVEVQVLPPQSALAAATAASAANAASTAATTATTAETATTTTTEAATNEATAVYTLEQVTVQSPSQAANAHAAESGATEALVFPDLQHATTDPAQWSQAALTQLVSLAATKLRSPRLQELLCSLVTGPRRSRELREEGFSSSQEQSLLRAHLALRIDFAQDIPAFDLKAAAKASSQRAFLHTPAADAMASSNADKAVPTATTMALQDDPILASEPLTLNEEQEQALLRINAQTGFGVFLLNGITGSGKTEIYLQAIEHCLRSGKRALILVPEISLTPQTFKRFFARFKVPIATSHSTLSQRERLDAFLDMSTQRAAILIGTRSALFTSIPDIGLIVIDEEHDSSFKQSDGLRYHARTLALYRAQECNCKVILGSATPSVESVYHVLCGDYQRIDLNHRALQAQLPTLEVVDLRQEELTDSVRAGVGHLIEEEVGKATAQHQQALLFLNRRGYSHTLTCHKCGYIFKCPNCDMQMTVHHVRNKLICHICGNNTYRIPHTCPQCHSENTLIETGLGTEQVADYLKVRFPDVGIERIDRDSMSSHDDFVEALTRVRQHQSEIVIGTQMIAKGHDFPDITMVGLLEVDGGLFCDDFRGLEYTAQLITQVAGRAGRAEHCGRVYIQTRYPLHPLIQRLIEPNFNYFNLASELLKLREAPCLPPYAAQAMVMTNSSDRELSFNTLQRLMDTVNDRAELVAGMNITPVLPDRVEKRFGRYHFHVVLTSKDVLQLHRLLDEIVLIFSSYEKQRDLRFAIDVDPIHNL